MDRIEVNVNTGERVVIPLTQVEIDDVLARQAAIDAKELPKRQAKEALEQLRASAKATTLFSVLENATLLQINTWVDNNFPDMTANQKSVMKVLMAVAGMYLREK